MKIDAFLSCVQRCSTRFMHACAVGDVPSLERCLSEDHALLLHKGLLGAKSTAWHVAASKGRADVLRALHEELLTHASLVVHLLAKRGKGRLSQEAAIQATVNSRDAKGRTPLMLACLAGEPECVKHLMTMGADPWLTDRCGARTALHYAAMRGAVSCIQAIMDAVPAAQRTRVQQGQNISLVDVCTVCGITPLHCAAVLRQPAAIRVLLSYGADPAAVTGAEVSWEFVYLSKGSTPLHASAKHGDYESVWEFLRHLAAHADSGLERDPRWCVDVDGHMPYFVAAQRRHRMVAEVLHPAINLQEAFDAGEVEPVGVPRLALLAASALKASLLAMVDRAIAQPQQPTANCAMNQHAESDHHSHGGEAAPVCAVCLDEAQQQLLLHPCHHLLCVACLRQLVHTMHDRPLACPMCRQHVKACHAPPPCE